MRESVTRVVSGAEVVASVSKGLAFYWGPVLKAYRWHGVAIATLMLVSAVLDMLTIALAVPLLEAVSGREGGRVLEYVTRALGRLGWSNTDKTVIFALLAMACLLVLLRSAFTLFHTYQTHAVVHSLRRRIKPLLFSTVLEARYDWLTQKGRGAVLHDMNTPATAAHLTMLNLAALLSALFNTAVMVSFMVYLSWQVTILVGVLGVAGIGCWRWFTHIRAQRCGKEMYDLGRELTQVEVDAIDGSKIVKAYGLKARMVEEQQRVLQTETRPMLQMAFYKSAPSLLNEFVAVIIVLALAAAVVAVPDFGMTFPTLVTFLLAMRRMNPSVSAMSAALAELNKLRSGLEVLHHIMETLPREKSGGHPVGPIDEIRFVDVSFSYPSRADEWALRGIDLHLRRGEVTAVVGSTGGGKSTLAQLVLRLYEPMSGAILADGIDLQELDLTEWRQKIGYVSQDVFLFNASIRDNIAGWDASIGDDQVESAARLAHLHDFVMTLPEGYDTLVGDRGLKLSGGQCQRVAIARAIVRRPNVLILDEATSALDNITEKAVYEAINALRKDAVVLVIAHRLNTVREADQIAVLRFGRIEEIGTHDALITTSGGYAALYTNDWDGGKTDAAAPAPVLGDRTSGPCAS